MLGIFQQASWYATWTASSKSNGNAWPMLWRYLKFVHIICINAISFLYHMHQRVIITNGQFSFCRPLYTWIGMKKFSEENSMCFIVSEAASLHGNFMHERIVWLITRKTKISAASLVAYYATICCLQEFLYHITWPTLQCHKLYGWKLNPARSGKTKL